MHTHGHSHLGDLASQTTKRIALSLGFVHVESGPLVRSSYHAHEQADAFQQSRNW